MRSLLLTNLEALPLHDKHERLIAGLKEIHPHLVLKTSKRARRIALRLDTSNRVMNLVVPERFSMKKAMAFAAEHRFWINEKLAGLPEPVPFAHGAKIPVLGQNRFININYNPDSRITKIDLHDDEITVKTNKEDPSARISRFLKNEAKATMTNLVHEKAAIIKRPVRTVQIRDTKSRWGSCGSDARISLSWRLIFAPWAAMDYVVAHEVAHLVHMNHGKRFWSLCNKLCENYADGKKWMRANGNELTRYGS